MPDGSWKCEKCNNINYPFRTKCNRQNCGADKPSESKESPSASQEDTDQVGCMIMMLFFIIYLHNAKPSIKSFIHSSLIICKKICCILRQFLANKNSNLSHVYLLIVSIKLLHRLIGHCLLFQWVLGRSRVVVQALLSVGCLKSESCLVLSIIIGCQLGFSVFQWPSRVCYITCRMVFCLSLFRFAVVSRLNLAKKLQVFYLGWLILCYWFWSDTKLSKFVNVELVTVHQILNVRSILVFKSWTIFRFHPGKVIMGIRNCFCYGQLFMRPFSLPSLSNVSARQSSCVLMTSSCAS